MRHIIIITVFLVGIGLLPAPNWISPALAKNEKVELHSPNGTIKIGIQLVKNQIFYSVWLHDRPIVEASALNLEFDEGRFSQGLKLGKPSFREGKETYELVVGKKKSVHDSYQELLLPIMETLSPFRNLQIRVRVFDDGLAFRYEFPVQAQRNDMVLLDEKTHFKLAGNPRVMALGLPSYTSSHEGVYTVAPLSAIPADSLFDMPALFDFDGEAFLGITEAALLDYAGMYLSKQAGEFVSMLSPLPGQGGVKVKAMLPHKSPWRVMLLSDRLGALLESTIITSLNEPNRLEDLSWIKPGKTTFPWWNGNIVPLTLNAPGNNFETAQYYIDFCARNGIEYHSVVEYGVRQWYVDDGVRYMPGPNADVTTPVAGLDMQRICDYGKQKGVGIRVWVHWAALYPQIDSAFALYEKWGIQGMMIDFMDRDDQEMVNIQTEMLEKAAKHHLHIQFHGAYKPTGLSRTYPNEFTREGTRNYEVNKWEPHGLVPFDDINIPFTRMLAGPTDYHLGGFRAVPADSFVTQYIQPLMLGTRAHQLAMYVVMESYLQIVSDYPKAYEGQPGFNFLKQVPTTWDDTKVLNALAGEYLTLVRKHGGEWYLGSITNDQPREFTISLSFLDAGTYRAEIYADASDVGKHPNHLQVAAGSVTSQDSLSIHLAAGGGHAIRFVKVE
ncbi:alpha-glucosidase [Dyadobacter jejuensis]|uniref:Alpha-glucosidase n=1 Tax=Dyadobacter jejuensis TaxID=1082580 RepID=A0A316ASC1_9BACT|nr:glycoside hydrolase family 97 protein [Dyadobacter jejuensis]PWJ60236.1 alpha-glucosidase [Dyadobacter jejuensis]